MFKHFILKSYKIKQRLIAYVASACLFSAQVIADDTDIYLTSSSNPAAPHMMLMFDYRTDMTATFCNANGGNSCANQLSAHPELLTALQGIVGVGNSADNISAVMAVFQVVFEKFEGIYVGLMMPNKNDGGTILRGYKEFQAGDANGAKAELISILQSIPVGGSGNNYFHDVAPKETHYELWRYLNGGAVENGDQTSANFQGSGTPGHDTSIMSGGNYISPFSTPGVDYSCTKLYEVYATSGNAGGNDDRHLDTEITADMSSAATDSQFDDMVDYLSNNDLVAHVTGDQVMKMWFIQMGSAATRTDDWANRAGTIDQYMNVGGNNVDLVDVQTTLEAAFIEALSVSATFVSASVPVNVFNRIKTLDNFYIALFEADSTERWRGNVKKMKLVDTDLTPDGIYDDIQDANNISAFNDSDGRIKYEALTYWTSSADLPAADPDKSEVYQRDGRSVDRGGAGQKIPGFIVGNGTVGTSTTTGTRQLYVEPSSGTSFDTFDVTNPVANDLQSSLGAADRAEALELISWARGIDIDDENGNSNRTEAREWLMGDAIHSRPLAINYGATSGYSEANPNIRLFMGTNDGFFHILENTTSSGAESGEEVFAFIPRESLGIIKTLRANTGASDHPYGMDGEPVALVVDQDNDGTIESGDEVYVYSGMRRGGKSYYALDVSNPNATPTLKWKITKTSGGDFDELGYTFSTPKVVKVKYENTERDVLIFAGGYDLQKDTDTGAGRNGDTEGNAIYIVDARTGALIWKAVGGSSTTTNSVYYQSDLIHSIPSDVAILDANSNGIVDRLYVGDTSGIVWRVDLPEGTGTNFRRDNWEITKFADADDSAESEDRRFFHAPDIVQTKDSLGDYDGILIGSGDRASPLETIDDNELYLFKDRYTTSGAPSSSQIDEDTLPDVTACETGLESGCSSINYQYGWKITLDNSGEKSLSTPVTAGGKVFFTTYQPGASSACVPSEGSGFLYAVDLKDGSAAYSPDRALDIGPGIPPSVTVIGNDTLILPGTGIVDPDDETNSGDKTKLIQGGGKPIFIIYWREAGQDSL